MGKQFNKFFAISFLVLLFFVSVIGILGYVYWQSAIEIYNLFIIIIIGIFLMTTLLFFTGMLMIFITYKKQKVSKWLAPLVFMAIRYLMPFVLLMTSLLKINKEIIKGFIIDINNILVVSKGLKYDPSKVLMILPHCIQYHNCIYKVTHDTSNCRQCGQCNIGGIIQIARKAGVKVEIVTGGTVARNIVKKYKPGIIVSVACERDLLSGIIDVGKIPVLGIINKRPNGPCFDTEVDLDELANRLQMILK